MNIKQKKTTFNQTEFWGKLQKIRKTEVNFCTVNLASCNLVALVQVQRRYCDVHTSTYDTHCTLQIHTYVFVCIYDKRGPKLPKRWRGTKEKILLWFWKPGNPGCSMIPSFREVKVEISSKSRCWNPFHRRKIGLVEGNAKCRHLKNLTCKGSLRGERGTRAKVRGTTVHWVENTNMTDCTCSL